jgi:hypothetical protein
MTMDLNKFFELFGSGSEETKAKKEVESFKKTPSFKVAMFIKLVTNGMNFRKQVVNFFSKTSFKGEDITDIDLTGEFMIYNRGWYWISQIDWDDQRWMEALKDSKGDELLVALKLSIHYFEECEEYEKCAVLKKIQDFVEKNLEA